VLNRDPFLVAGRLGELCLGPGLGGGKRS